jgi:high-affinity Fe2+/Pb2+ permease
LGYLFGHGFALVIGDIRHYELRLFILLAVSGLFVWSIHWFRQRKSGRHSKAR